MKIGTLQSRTRIEFKYKINILNSFILVTLRYFTFSCSLMIKLTRSFTYNTVLMDIYGHKIGPFIGLISRKKNNFILKIHLTLETKRCVER